MDSVRFRQHNEVILYQSFLVINLFSSYVLPDYQIADYAEDFVGLFSKSNYFSQDVVGLFSKSNPIISYHQ